MMGYHIQFERESHITVQMNDKALWTVVFISSKKEEKNCLLSCIYANSGLLLSCVGGEVRFRNCFA